MVTNVAIQEFARYSIPVGVVASVAIGSVLWASIRTSQVSKLTAWSNILHAIVTIISVILTLISTVKTFRGVDGEEGLYRLALLTLLGTLIKQVNLNLKQYISAILCAAVPARFSFVPGILSDISNLFHYAYGVLYVYSIQVIDAKSSPEETQRVKTAGKVIVYIAAVLQGLVIFGWVYKLSTHKVKMSRYILTGLRIAAALGSIATNEYFYVVGGMLLVLLVPARFRSDVVGDDSPFEKASGVGVPSSCDKTVA
ncbi:hypothetical protein T439DRAFT_378302 [Meredithblackwellia eburnea MCA 4105]